MTLKLWWTRYIPPNTRNLSKLAWGGIEDVPVNRWRGIRNQKFLSYTSLNSKEVKSQRMILGKCWKQNWFGLAMYLNMGAKIKCLWGEEFIIIMLTFELLLFITKLEPHKNSPNWLENLETETETEDVFKGKGLLPYFLNENSSLLRHHKTPYLLEVATGLNSKFAVDVWNLWSAWWRDKKKQN